MIKRTPIRKVRSKPRPGRLKNAELELLRMKCWERDKGLCQRCGQFTDPDKFHTASDSYHMAHKRGKRMWGDSLDQVETFCGDCHRRFHNFGPTMQKPCPPKPIDTDSV
jgi:5-methylcytosine-specific restriction endonuclease McrA